MILQKFRWTNKIISVQITKKNFYSVIKNQERIFLPGTVILSTSNDIYQNLAFEDWIYRNVELKDSGILLIWKNRPAVVIGHHQNPWTECNLKILQEKNIQLARRNSGGGTVYHDLENLNCSFLTSRSKYNRKINLNIICRALRQKWNLDVSISKREDLVVQEEFKISGTASKIGRENAYHHCTVLVNVESQILKEVLNKNKQGISSKATESVESKVINLQQLESNLKIEDVANEIACQYQMFHEVENGKIVTIYPKEEEFSDIESIVKNLKSWECIYGRTPRFTVEGNFLINNNKKLFCNPPANSDVLKVTIQIGVYHGCIEHVQVISTFADEELQSSINKCLCGVRFTPQNVSSALQMWSVEHNSKGITEMYIKETLRRALS